MIKWDMVTLPKAQGSQGLAAFLSGAYGSCYSQTSQQGWILSMLNMFRRILGWAANAPFSGNIAVISSSSLGKDSGNTWVSGNAPSFY